MVANQPPMRSRFRTGPVQPCACFLSVIPRSVMIGAIVRHCGEEPRDGEVIRSDHAHEGYRFHIETRADRDQTVIRLTEAMP